MTVRLARVCDDGVTVVRQTDRGDQAPNRDTTDDGISCAERDREAKKGRSRTKRGIVAS